MGLPRALAALARQPLLVIALVGLLALAGILAFRELPIDAFPDLTNIQVQVLADVPALPAEEVEPLVTLPLETGLAGLPRVTAIRSLTKFGLSVVTVVFEDRVDPYFARQLVLERLQTVQARLPQDVRPEMGPMTTGMGEVYQYLVEGVAQTPMDLKRLHDWDIRLKLRTVPGVNEVNTWGGLTPEYQVQLSPERLWAHQLSVTDVAAALGGTNLTLGGGILVQGPEQAVLRGDGRVRSTADIARTVVAYRDGVPITVAQLGDVAVGPAFRQGAVTHDGVGEGVCGIVMMRRGENSQAVIDRVKTKLAELRPHLPEGVSLKPFYDQTQLVENTLHTLQTNLLEGSLLVVGVLFLLLGNGRGAMIVASVIPLALLIAFIGMRAFGVTANLMSLGAMDFGMVVDGAVVMVEHILSLRARHIPAEAAVTETLMTMSRPIGFGVLIITVVFLPVLALEGLEYRMFSPMVITVCLALLGALVLAFTWVPALSGLLLRAPIREKPSPLLQAVAKPYARLLRAALNRPKQTLLAAVLALGVGLALVPALGTEFVPRLDEGDWVIEVRNAPTISLAEATQVSTRVERVLARLPEVRRVVSRSGRPDLATDPMGVYNTDVYVMLKPHAAWRRGLSADGLKNEIRESLGRDVPEAMINLTQPIEMRVNELVSGVRADVAIKVFGPSLADLQTAAAQVERVLQRIPGATDVQRERVNGTTQVLIRPDRDALARWGLRVSDLRPVLEATTAGIAVSEVVDGPQRTALRVKLQAPAGADGSGGLAQLLLTAPDGRRVPLLQVADIRTGEAVEAIQREDGQRRVLVQCNIRNRDVGRFVADAQAAVRQQVTLPPGVMLDWGGQFENQRRAMARLSAVVPAAIGLVFLLLLATFRNLRDALMVMLNVPFATVGGVVALWLRGLYLSVPAAIGFVALFGVAMLNGLVLISTIREHRAAGFTLREAIERSAEERLRPVLMTALVATLGFLPMALSTSTGAEVQRPLATVVIGGLVSATLLTLVVLPTLYAWVGGASSGPPTPRIAPVTVLPTPGSPTSG